MKFEIDGNIFVTSSFSPRGVLCVGISIQDEEILVTSSKDRNSIVSFSHDEWAAFIAGVKQGEFDLNENN